MINTLEDAINFSQHPVAAYDPFYTKDVFLFRSVFDCFVHFIRESILSNPDGKYINYLHGLYFDLIQKVQSYERHTGVNLFPTRFWEQSLFRSLYSSVPLTHD